MAGYTTYADRQQMVLRHEQGASYRQISQESGWSYETVRQMCRRYRRQGGSALHPAALGRPKRGPLSSCAPLVRWAVLKLKCQHPGWGPDVIEADLATRPWASQVKLPKASQIGAYLSQFGARLLTPRPHKRLSAAQPGQAAPVEVHGCWQLDVDEGVELPGYGQVNTLDIVDHTSGLKIGSFLFPAQAGGQPCRVAWPQYRHALRQAFSRWGLPDRVRTDRERVLVPQGDYPFPTAFTLWLVGLGIEHEVIRRVTQNGGVERSHRTWVGRLSGYGPLGQLAQWQQLVDYECWRMNAVLPSRGRNCRRQPPLLVYPQARQPRRWYRPQDELALFDPQRVQAYLTQGRWLRRTTVRGQFWLNDQVFNLRVPYANRWVQITYVPEVGFQATCPPDPGVILTFQMEGLTASDLTGLYPTAV